ncbi:MAG: U32 family peptidase [Planctomycetota bacterium]|jgi:putative protease|nr:U32 family peptidase [Planctomycetota bacterium]
MSHPSPARLPELLAPAGGPEAGFAALHHGADAVYLGLTRFSARAEAVNFTPGQLAEFTAYARRLTPRRRVYLALNTLIKQSELPEIADIAATAADCRVDAVIVQDLGIIRLFRERFPGIPLHASTQMAIHDIAGVRAAADLGCVRATLARELTLAEIARIAAEGEIEVEAFIHGTLCYSYSGLCLFSSLAGGRSGNRGRCLYSCREAVIRPEGRVHPFSLKDLALGEKVLDLAQCGVNSLKIEGRKKSPLYVAATVDYYRKILDGGLAADERLKIEDGLGTIFARPWTRLFLDGRQNPEAVDLEVVGHRGASLGRILQLAATPAGPGIRLKPRLPLERHDGCQINVPGLPRPFGFALNHLYRPRGGRLTSVFAVPAGEEAFITLPKPAPPLAAGLPVYLASSQAVKRSYPFPRPRPGKFGREIPIDLEVSIAENDSPAGTVLASCRGGTGEAVFVLARETAASPAREANTAETAAKKAFSRLGGKRFVLGGWTFHNPRSFFIPPGFWNRLRRDWLAGLEGELSQKATAARRKTAEFAIGSPPDPAPSETGSSWSLFAEDPASLARLSASDLSICEEVVVGLGKGGKDGILELSDLVGREKLRLAPPLIHRGNLDEMIAGWLERGWRRWLLPGLAGWRLLSGVPGTDVASDWTIPVLNRLAAGQLLAMGFSRFTLSPEDEYGDWESLAREYPGRAWLLAYSEMPLFISAACVHAHLGRCRTGGNRCALREDGLELTMERGGRVTAWPQQPCGTVVTGAHPFSLGDRLNRLPCRHLRLDFRWRPYEPAEAAKIWRQARAGLLPFGIEGNLRRGLA